MAQLFERALRARLLSLSGVTDIIGTALFKTYLPQTYDLGARGPALTYEASNKTRGQLLTRSDGTATAYVKFGAWSYNYLTSKKLIEAIYNGIDGKPGTWGDGTCEILSSVQQDDSDATIPPLGGNDQWIYRVNCDYAIRYRVAIPTLT